MRGMVSPAIGADVGSRRVAVRSSPVGNQRHSRSYSRFAHALLLDEAHREQEQNLHERDERVDGEWRARGQLGPAEGPRRFISGLARPTHCLTLASQSNAEPVHVGQAWSAGRAHHRSLFTPISSSTTDTDAGGNSQASVTPNGFSTVCITAALFK